MPEIKSTPPPQTSHSNSLPLEMTQKLKVFALLSFKRDVPLDFLNDHKLSLTLSAAYSQGDAILAAKQSLLSINLKPDDYKIPVMMISVEADQMIQQEPKVIVPTKKGEEIGDKLFEAVKNISKDSLEEIPMGVPRKSVEEIVAHILYAFDKVGTAKEKEIVKKVVEKFKKLVKK
ncbi:hypothetical protein KAJ89_03225 [Candidatus Parcubacteria bacterium]|nr:hypothetical protein [Candidatus Parcubacteria bacterium]